MTNQPRRIIGLCGYARSGKDEAAKGLVADGWTRIALADGVRDALYALNPDVSEIHSTVQGIVDRGGWDDAKRYGEIRGFLQRMGTEAGRNIHGDDCWIKIVKRKIKATEGNVVISDIRYANEADAVRSWGGIVLLIERPGVGPINGHSSEVLDFSPDEVIVNDGSISELQDHLRFIANPLEVA